MDKSEVGKAHFCPGCGARQRHFARYPWYFCQSCLKRACDIEGALLVFGNASFSGGLSWGYRANPDMRDEEALRVLCLINDRPVLVHEARFGGVVAEPVSGDLTVFIQMNDRNLVNLVHKHHLVDARMRLQGSS